MTVAELIEFLQKQQQDLPVAIKMFSEQCLIDADDIEIKELCEQRPDGWIHNKRDDKPGKMYLVLPGN